MDFLVLKHVMVLMIHLSVIKSVGKVVSVPQEWSLM